MAMGTIKRVFSAAALTVVGFFILSCATTPPDTTSRGKDLMEGDKAKAAEFTRMLDEINAAAPDTINSSLTADGEASGKKFKVEGRVVYDKKGYFFVSLKDFVFRSPVLDAYREGEKLYFHYPAENKLIADDVNKINLYNYSGFKAEYHFIQTLFTGGIPLIKGYNVNRVFKEEDDAYYLILENSDFFENIYFKKVIPEKILLMHKESKNKAEIYLRSVVRKDKSYFFRQFKIVAPGLGVSMNLTFLNPVLNGDVKVPGIEPLKKKKGIQIIKVN
jgi:hypothetical protein